MTKYYHVANVDKSEVVATDGKYAVCLPYDMQGIDTTSGVDLYRGTLEEITEKLRSAYAKIEYLYDMRDYWYDWDEDDIYKWSTDDYNYIAEIITIE